MKKKKMQKSVKNEQKRAKTVRYGTNNRKKEKKIELNHVLSNFEFLVSTKYMARRNLQE